MDDIFELLFAMLCPELFFALCCIGLAVYVVHGAITGDWTGFTTYLP